LSTAHPAKIRRRRCCRRAGLARRADRGTGGGSDKIEKCGIGGKLIALNRRMDSAGIIDNTSLCQACGACCAYSSNWPRFTTEDDAALDLIPQQFVNDRLSGMRCEGERCSALNGKIGVATSCG